MSTFNWIYKHIRITACGGGGGGGSGGRNTYSHEVNGGNGGGGGAACYTSYDLTFNWIFNCSNDNLYGVFNRIFVFIIVSYPNHDDVKSLFVLHKNNQSYYKDLNNNELKLILESRLLNFLLFEVINVVALSKWIKKNFYILYCIVFISFNKQNMYRVLNIMWGNNIKTNIQMVTSSRLLNYAFY